MGAIVAWTLNVETNPLNLLCTNINWDEVENLKDILFHSTTIIQNIVFNGFIGYQRVLLFNMW